MSRNIDLSKPLSDEDREYLKRRARWWDIEMNDQTFKNSEVDPDSESEADASGEDEKVSVSDIEALTVAELRDELKLRELSDDGLKADLVKRLSDHIRENGGLKEE